MKPFTKGHQLATYRLVSCCGRSYVLVNHRWSEYRRPPLLRRTQIVGCRIWHLLNCAVWIKARGFLAALRTSVVYVWLQSDLGRTWLESFLVEVHCQMADLAPAWLVHVRASRMIVSNGRLVDSDVVRRERTNVSTKSVVAFSRAQCFSTRPDLE